MASLTFRRGAPFLYDKAVPTLSPMSRAWRIGDLVKSFVPIMLTDAVHPGGSCYTGLCAQQDLLVVSRGGNMTREYRVKVSHEKRDTPGFLNGKMKESWERSMFRPNFGYEILED